MIINSSQFYKPYLPLSSNLAIRKEIFKRIGFFNEGIQAYEEIEFLWRVLTKGYKIFYTPKAKVWHNHPGSLIKLAKRYFRDGKGCMEFLLRYPNSPLSLVRLTLFLGWLFYLSFLFLSLLFRNLEILFLIFFLPLSLLFLYYFYVCFKRKYALAILYPFLDIMLCGIVYPLGMLIKLFSLTKRLHYEAK
jgi:GT2 family glycosyltransferase